MKYILCFLALFTLCTIHAQRPPMNRMKGPNFQRFEEPMAKSGIIHLYQKYISPIDGDRCPMHPGCSTFMAEAIEKKGVFLGVLMGTDRLLRCGRKLQSYPWILRGNSFFAWDPVEDQ